MKAFNFACGLLLLSAASGCTSLQSVSVTNIPHERGRPVEANADNLAFLGIHFSNDFADDLPEALRRQCPHGKVTGVFSKYESTWYVLVEERDVTLHGYCVAGAPRATPAVTTPAPAESPAPVAAPPVATQPPPLAVPSPSPGPTPSGSPSPPPPAAAPEGAP